jgi:16S rRNA (adenine1518-N6/adenine1519-N6)-dimethyltransferase
MPARDPIEPGGPPRHVRSTLRQLDIRPTKGRGQNFLISQQVVDQILEVLDATHDDIVVEVGPGLGMLTESLVGRAGRVVAIEIDQRLVEHLRVHLQHQPIKIVEGDALLLPEEAFVPEDGDYLFVANLPYSVGTAILRRFLELDHPPRRMVGMVQKEVAERMVAMPPEMSILALAVQIYAEPRIAFDVPPGAFVPRPKVTSSVVVLDRRRVPLVPPADREAFFDLVHAAFHQKRKQLANTISTGMSCPKSQVTDWLLRAGIDPTRRAETLAIQEWLALLAEGPGTVA